jgi:hypothetical protein
LKEAEVRREGSGEVKVEGQEEEETDVKGKGREGRKYSVRMR